MRAITYTSARGDLAKTMKKVCDDHNPIVITRKKTEAVVMISLEDYEALNETAYLCKVLRMLNVLLNLSRNLKRAKVKIGFY